MTKNDRPTYVGPSDLHDATISGLEERGSAVRVELTSFTSRRITLEFEGVSQISGKASVGIMIYGLIEERGSGNLCRFTFVPWEEAWDQPLVIVAAGFREIRGR